MQPRAGVFQYNVALYDVQCLPYADHILDVALVNYTLANGSSKGSLIRYDYAAINDTKALADAQPSAGQPTTTNSNSIHTNRSKPTYRFKLFAVSASSRRNDLTPLIT